MILTRSNQRLVINTCVHGQRLEGINFNINLTAIKQSDVILCGEEC